MQAGIRSRPELVSGVPEDLVAALDLIEQSFNVDKFSLKRITDHFAAELEKGLTAEGGDIPMYVTWVMGYPTGKEEGRFLILDLGGTKLRIMDARLIGDGGGMDMTQQRFTVPDNIKVGMADDLWDYVAQCVQIFLETHPWNDERSDPLPLAFAFSYPIVQSSVKSGVLQRWTKDFSVSGVEGHDVVAQLESALERKKIPVKVAALTNDATGTLIASAYQDKEVKIGCISSTGCNAAYMEAIGSIPKTKDCGVPDDALVAINTEYGAFDNTRRVLPRTEYDKRLDRGSAHPGEQQFEKMVAGLYLGELIRLVILELYNSQLLFVGQNLGWLAEPRTIDTSFLSVLEEDISESMDDIRKALWSMGINAAPHELKVCRYLAELVGTRVARLFACGTAAICKKQGIERCHVGVDGSVFSHYASYGKRATQALREIFDTPAGSEDPIQYKYYPDGSGVGAALIAALAVERSDGVLLMRR
ncbi:putative hexokinase [Aspergillus clavatus NRRL 1]|uniref:Phosphotransferase n=1 Tax=Aspergillus clavatus (strain ATCC 1007 / CBS 513.65 / DSM 816 / NCTC 3887 / NRRL 1 / QM 1276 / 107) TaxID=344612 RepID=A1CME5_ASPCL|nr:hexokinase, putative [Aspergillus clavatus NRRL 1]EAW08732.1 hexokinase, putative [Aspergillus clavatus NRRL 1]